LTQLYPGASTERQGSNTNAPAEFRGERLYNDFKRKKEAFERENQAPTLFEEVEMYLEQDERQAERER
jgi:hypothetical protein